MKLQINVYKCKFCNGKFTQIPTFSVIYVYETRHASVASSQQQYNSNKYNTNIGYEQVDKCHRYFVQLDTKNKQHNYNIVLIGISVEGLKYIQYCIQNNNYKYVPTSYKITSTTKQTKPVGIITSYQLVTTKRHI